MTYAQQLITDRRSFNKLVITTIMNKQFQTKLTKL